PQKNPCPRRDRRPKTRAFLRSSGGSPALLPISSLRGQRNLQGSKRQESKRVWGNKPAFLRSISRPGFVRCCSGSHFGSHLYEEKPYVHHSIWIPGWDAMEVESV